MHYFARFERHNGARFRFDTRIYLNPEDSPGPHDSCVGAIIGKNPGSALPTLVGHLSSVDIGLDKFLPTAKRCFAKAYAIVGKVPPKGAFVRVWNLFYLCDPNLDRAIEALKRIPARMCDSESEMPPIAWFAWGPAHAELDNLKVRFRNKQYTSPFFVDQKNECTSQGIPQQDDFPRHTQGMEEAPVIAYLAALL